jgi:hypothetical protein
MTSLISLIILRPSSFSTPLSVKNFNGEVPVVKASHEVTISFI